MGHAGNIKQVYLDLAHKLNTNVVGLPEPQDSRAKEGWQKILELFYSPEDAYIGSQLPIHPTQLEEISKHLKIDKSILKIKLDKMADKGIVMDILNPQNNEMLYSLSPPVYGFFELTMMKIGSGGISKDAFVSALSVYGGNSDVFIRELHGSGETALGRTLVYDSLIKDERFPEVYNWEKVISVIESSDTLAVSNCYCRHKAEHMGTNCSNPVETCFSLNQFSEYVIRRNFGRKVDQSEAKEILYECREHKLVHLVDNVKKNPAWLCNCCSCCCGIIKSINNYGFPAASPSPFLPVQSDKTCRGCKLCEKSCPINALTIERIDDNSKKKYIIKIDETKCLGCGVCVYSCPQQILILKQREKKPYIPDSSIELSLLRAYERGKLSEFIYNKGSSLGSTFLNYILKIIKNLPILKKAPITEQLKSRFIRYYMKELSDN